MSDRKLPAALIARRSARGWSREEAAARIEVDKQTIYRWEQGTHYPSRTEVIERIKSLYNFTQEQWDELYDDWFFPHNRKDVGYEVSGTDYLSRRGIDEYELLDKLIALDTNAFRDLLDVDEGTTEQWAPIFVASMYSWRLLTQGEDIVGYWQYLCLKDEPFERVKAGNLRDSQITLDMLDYPSFVGSEANYKMYFVVIAADASKDFHHRGQKLILSFIKDLQDLALNGVFFSEIAAVAHTPIGLKMCRDFGMRHLQRHVSGSEKRMAEVFHTTGDRIAVDGYLSKRKRIADLYKSRFPIGR